MNGFYVGFMKALALLYFFLAAYAGYQEQWTRGCFDLLFCVVFTLWAKEDPDW